MTWSMTQAVVYCLEGVVIFELVVIALLLIEKRFDRAKWKKATMQLNELNKDLENILKEEVVDGKEK